MTLVVVLLVAAMVAGIVDGWVNGDSICLTIVNVLALVYASMRMLRALGLGVAPWSKTVKR